MSGKLIVVEGIEGAGKTTVVERLVSWLREVHGVEVNNYREPGDTVIGEAVRTLIKHPDSNISVQTQSELLWLSRRCLLEEIIKPLLAKGTWVVLDRYWLSTIVYQHDYYNTRPLNELIAEILDEYAIPDFLIYLNVDPHVAKYRCMHGEGRGQVADKNDDQPIEVFKQWAGRYNATVATYNSLKPVSAYTLTIDSNQSPNDVCDDVIFSVNELI